MNRLLISLLLVAGCHRAAPATEVLLRDGQDETRRLFALAEGGDCSQLRSLLVRPEGCEAMVDDYRKTHSHLVSVDDAKIDGRDAHVVLVTVTVQSARHTHTWVVRAKWNEDGWRMSL